MSGGGLGSGIWGEINGIWGIWPPKQEFGIWGLDPFGIWDNVSGLWGT